MYPIDYEEWLDLDDENYSVPQKIKSKKPKEKNYSKVKNKGYRKERLAKQKERESLETQEED